MPLISAYSHGFGAVIMLFTTAALLHRKQPRAHILVLALATTAIWASISTFYTLGYLSHYGWVLGADVCRQTTWVICLLSLVKHARFNHGYIAPYQRVLTGLVISVAGLLFINALLLDPTRVPWLFGPRLKYAFLGHIILAIVGLSLIEQLYRHVRESQRTDIQLFCIGLGSLLGYDFYLYANALLLNALDIAMWEARGAVSAIATPLIAWSAMRHQQDTKQLFPSRSVVFGSTAVFACGLYLLVMGLASYYIQYVGGHWGRVVQVIFLVVAGLILMLLLTSTQIRAKAKHFLNRHFYQQYYDYRAEWMRFSTLLTLEDEDRPLTQRIIVALSNLLQSPAGYLIEYRDETWICTSSWQAAALTTDDMLALEPQLERCFREARLIERGDANNIWLMIPLIHHDKTIGCVCLTAPLVPLRLNWEVRQLLRTAAYQAAVFLSQARTSQALSDAKQFEGYNRLAAFVMHDLKNIAMQLSLLSSNAKRHAKNPAFIESAFQTIAHTTTQMQDLMQSLQTGQIDNTQQVLSLNAVLTQAVKQTMHLRPQPELILPETVHYTEAHPTQLNNVLVHLIQNAQEATAQDGQVIVRLLETTKGVCIEIEDTGCGMSAAFIQDGLFRPFVSTKGHRGMGIGVFEAKSYIHSLAGKMTVESEEGTGTLFRIHLLLTVRQEKDVA